MLKKIENTNKYRKILYLFVASPIIYGMSEDYGQKALLQIDGEKQKIMEFTQITQSFYTTLNVINLQIIMIYKTYIAKQKLSDHIFTSYTENIETKLKALKDGLEEIPKYKTLKDILNMSVSSSFINLKSEKTDTTNYPFMLTEKLDFLNNKEDTDKTLNIVVFAINTWLKGIINPKYGAFKNDLKNPLWNTIMDFIDNIFTSTETWINQITSLEPQLLDKENILKILEWRRKVIYDGIEILYNTENKKTRIYKPELYKELHITKNYKAL